MNVDTGAEVRLLRVAELAPQEAIERNERWLAHKAFVEGAGGTASGGVSVATLDDLEWAQGVALGAPTRFGMPAAAKSRSRM